MFTFNGVHASTYGGVVKVPSLKRAKQKTNLIKIDGSDKTLKEKLGYESIVLPCSMNLIPNVNEDNFNLWLSGSGRLILDEDNTKYYNAEIDEEVEVDYIQLGVYRRKATFEFIILDPFRYLITEADVTLVAPGNVTLGGTYFSEPLIKLTGTGLVTVTINGRVFSYNFDTPYVYIDSQSHQAYHSTINKNRKLSGDFPLSHTSNSYGIIDQNSSGFNPYSHAI